MARAKSKHASWVAYMKGIAVTDDDLQTVKEDLETVIQVLAELGDGNSIMTRAIKSKLFTVEDMIRIRAQK